MPCGIDTETGTAALRIVEQVDTDAPSEPFRVTTWITPDYARIQDANGEIVLDVPARFVAFYDLDAGIWDVQSLESFGGWVDSVASAVYSASEFAAPRFEKFGGKSLVAGYDCQRYTMELDREQLGAGGEHVRQDLWMTRDIEMTGPHYAMLRSVSALFDRTWHRVPVERPRGVVMRSVTVVQRPDAGPGETELEWEESIVEEIGYRITPRTFFLLAVPAADIELRR
jgi:hypothetical protein